MDLVTPREAARQLGVSYPTLKQWIYKGSVRTRRTAGGHHRIPATEIDRLLTAGGKSPSRRVKPVKPVSGTGARRSGAGRQGSAGHGTIVTLSGRNQLRGFVEEVRVEGLLAQVRLRVGDQSLTAIITRDAVDELRLRRGDEAVAVIKATEVMVAR